MGVDMDKQFFDDLKRKKEIRKIRNIQPEGLINITINQN